jgi:HSP20 family protein
MLAQGVTIEGMPCDPLRDLRAWQERLERLAAQHGHAWVPPIDVYETEDRYVVTAEVPGLDRQEIDVAVQDNRLMIRGLRSAGTPEGANRHYHQVERGHGSFERTFRFADPVQENGITADLRDGVLTITLPKAATPPRRIQVS